MGEVFFQSILIADLQNRTAHFQDFEKGLNVVTSGENHVGKSSLLKSLFHSIGAEVDYDSVWARNSKLYITEICANDKVYLICRLMNHFAVFCEDKLVLTTDSVTKGLAPFLEEIFNFSVYLSNKKTEKIELAPPAFTFMPYTILIKILVGVGFMTVLRTYHSIINPTV